MKTQPLQRWAFGLKWTSALCAGSLGCLILFGKHTFADMGFVPISGVVALAVCGVGLFLIYVRIWGIRSHEHQLRDLLEAGPDAVVLLGQNGRIVCLNSQAELLFGYSQADLVDQSFDRLVRGQNGPNPGFTSPHDSTITKPGLQPNRPCYVGVHQSGRLLVVEVSVNALTSRNENLILYTIRDVTEVNQKQRRRSARHAVRRLLLDSESLDTVAPSLLQAICECLEWDFALWWKADASDRPYATWHAAEVNLDVYNATLRDRAQRRGQPASHTSVSATRPSWPGAVLASSYRVTCSPQEVPLESLSLPLTVGAEVLGAIELFRQKVDIADDNVNETLTVIGAQIGQMLQRQRDEAALRSSEARKTAILEAALDGVVTVSHEGKILELNAAAMDMYGVTAEQLIGAELSHLLLPPRVLGDKASWSDFLCQRETTIVGQRLELVGCRFDGTCFPVEVALAPILGDETPMYTAYIRDLTERKKTEAALKQVEEQFRQSQKLEAIGRLAGGVAHDFNNLLTVINGTGEHLLQTLPHEAPERELVESITHAGHRAADLTRQLLMFSRKQELQPQVIDLTRIVADMKRLLARLLGSQFQLETDLSQTSAPIIADPNQIGQVLLNLVVNARDAMPKGGVVAIRTEQVELTAPRLHRHAETPPGTYVVLRIRDHGCGMDEQTLSRIFEPFFTTKEVGKGTGLGLSCVYGIVTQSGGSIEVDSQPGVGTTFTLYFPVTKQSQPVARLEVLPHVSPMKAMPLACAAVG
jgi:PAS domain S-box-containing protein